MTEKSLRIAPVFAITILVVSLVALFAWPGGLLFTLINAGALVMELLVLRYSRPNLLKRRISMDNWWDKILIPVIAFCLVAAVSLSVYDNAVLHISLIPGWFQLLGIVLLMSAYMLMVQSFRAQPPHMEEKYGGKAAEGQDRGPYEVIRHPVMLGVLIAGLSIPMFFSSGIGFIPVGIMLAAIITRVAAEDDWRFNNYEWFYDYTKAVSYRLIPFIW